MSTDKSSTKSSTVGGVQSLSIVDATETWLASDSCEAAIRNIYQETIKGQGGNDRHIDFAVFTTVVEKLHDHLM